MHVSMNSRMGRVLRALWSGWMRFVEVLGTIQMIVLLTVLFWTMLAVVAIPANLLSDPLQRRRRESHWNIRNETPEFDDLRAQG